MKNIIILNLIFLMVISAIATAQTRHVPDDYPTIQAAIDAANNGDEIIVAEGTYLENINFYSKNIVLKSTDPNNQDVVADTIIDGNQNNPVVTFNSGEDANCVLDGFTITNGNAVEGGGIYCRNSSPIVTNCTIINNSSGDGGGIYCIAGNPTIKNCIITGNSAGDNGGGTWCSEKTIITNCIICDNHASDQGGGIYCYNGKSIITNCTVCDNHSSDVGGGIFCHIEGNPVITNCIIWGNVSPKFPQLFILFFNDDPTYSCIENWTSGGEGNICENPYFIPGANYHLMPYSSCIDRGTNAPTDGLPPTDLDGKPRTLDGNSDGIAVADMGAYEFQEPNVPLIAFIPLEYEFRHYKGLPNPQPKTLSIWNAGPDILCWQINEDCNWLDVSTTSGQSSGESDEVILAIDAFGLDPCSYSCTLTITDPNRSDWTHYILVQLIVGSVLYVPSQYPTIQAAIDAADNNDLVLVADGIYIGDGNRDLDFHGKLITVKSANGPENCIIDCNGSKYDSHRAFYFHTNETAKSIVDGFTLTNGYARDGGGIYCKDFSSPTIINCIITDSLVLDDGGGICCEDNSSPMITNCIVNKNLAYDDGGGICSTYDSSPMIKNCIFSNNSAAGNGGALSFDMYFLKGGSTITNCAITDNSADGSAGGVYCVSRSILTIINCVISDNCTSGVGSGICCLDGSTTDIKNCIISGNSTSVYGGGIFCDRSDTTITNCTVSENSSLNGGGGIFCCNISSVKITSCMISDNSVYPSSLTSPRGGGIYCHNSDTKITSCTISGNSVHLGSSPWADGGGIYCNEGDTTITNCTIYGNSSTSGGGIYCAYRNNSNINNSILWNNTAPDGPQVYLSNRSNLWVNYSDIEGGQDNVYIGPDSELNWGLGNIDVNPLFDETGYWDANGFWVNGDYHLREGSPCIDAGDPNYVAEPNETDLGGLPRLIGSRIDMGAYEYWPPVQAEMKITPNMLNCKSKGNWVKARIVLPEGYMPDDVDVEEPAFAELPQATIDSEYIKVLGNDDGLVRLEIGFDRQVLCELLMEGDSIMAGEGSVEITVVGYLTTGQSFYGSDSIRIKH